MKLYHGTSKQALEGILKEGILPRKEGVCNWEKYPSSPKMVYLTVAYPFYFGLVHASKSEEIVVLEIDSDLLATSKLYPDEDYLSQVRSDIMSRSGQCLRWLAIKGYANDWCVYVALHFGHSGNEDEYVAKVGDKVSMKENIRRALPCEDAVLERYRY